MKKQGMDRENHISDLQIVYPIKHLYQTYIKNVHNSVTGREPPNFKWMSKRFKQTLPKKLYR